MILPVYNNGPRSKWIIKIGLLFYDILSGKANIAKHQWISKEEIKLKCPNLKTKNLKGAFRFSDGQMDDYELGMWVANKAKEDGVEIIENSEVKKIDLDGNIIVNNSAHKFDRIVNTCGPWAHKLIENSNIKGQFKLDLIRGSHILIKGEPDQPYFLQAENDGRIFFVLPYNGNTLIGTTEIRQELNQPIEPSKDEINYLISEYNKYFFTKKNEHDIIKKFAGLRPLVSSTKNPRDIKREYKIEIMDSLINVYGGKWTTAMSLGRKVAKKVLV